MPALKLQKGDLIRLVTGGGGGFGKVEDRNLDMIQADVDSGYISPEQASSDYKVILDSNDKIDVVRTKQTREKIV